MTHVGRAQRPRAARIAVGHPNPSSRSARIRRAAMRASSIALSVPALIFRSIQQPQLGIVGPRRLLRVIRAHIERLTVGVIQIADRLAHNRAENIVDRIQHLGA